MLGTIAEYLNPYYLIGHPEMWLLVLFQLWMIVDALRKQEWIWAAFMFFFPMGLNAILYFFMVFRQGGGGGGGGVVRGFEFPGAADRRRIKEIQARIYHLDNARDHLDLADLYFAQGKLERAEESYRAALSRDPADVDTIAHLGQCLLRRGKATEAEPLLQQVAAANPRHDYGHTLMALAEAQEALGRPESAELTWRKVLENHGYARARVQYAELLARRGEKDRARSEINEVLSDDAHAPKFQRERDRVWIRRANQLLAKL